LRFASNLREDVSASSAKFSSGRSGTNFSI
jgi:hypothetical protein